MSNPFNLVRSQNVINPFGISKGGMAQRVSNFVDKHSMWMIYLRRDERFPDPDAYLSDSRSGDPNNKLSLEMGYTFQLEKHPVRRVIQASSMYSPNSGVGFLGQYTNLIYTSRALHQKQTDLYFEVEWDVPQAQIRDYGRPVRVIQCYQVDETSITAESDITYRVCICQQYDFSKTDLEKRLIDIPQNWVIPDV